MNIKENKLVIIDKRLRLYYFDLENNKFLFDKKLLDILELPDVIQKFGAFEMGYPYYINLYNTNICFTTDFGIIILEII